MTTLRKTLPLLLVFVAAFGLPWPGGLSYAKKSGLTPAKVKQIKKTRKSYENCRKDALAKLKDGKITQKKFEVALTACKENFPGADLYVTCKKQAVHTAKTKNIAADQAIDQCKRYLVATQFDPDMPVPFFIEAGQLYFAGIGLNHSMPASALNPPNFDCAKLQNVVRSPAQAQYLLFGNHPHTFAGLADLKPAALVKTLKIGKPAAAGTDVQGLGRVFGDVKGTSGVVFFPSASCDFDADPGAMFAGLSAYYLLDEAGSAIAPYFGIAYFKADQTQVTTPKLIQAVIKSLGPNFKSYSKNNEVSFIATTGMSETDDEQDPKNLCRQPRQHRFVGVVQGRKDDPNHPDYLILANVKNLCDFGDRLTKRLVE